MIIFFSHFNQYAIFDSDIPEIDFRKQIAQLYLRFNQPEEALKEFDRINSNLYNCNRKSQFLSGIMQPLMMFIGNFGYVCVCVVGALLVINNIISFGVIVAFMIYIRLFPGLDH